MFYHPVIPKSQIKSPNHQNQYNGWWLTYPWLVIYYSYMANINGYDDGMMMVNIDTGWWFQPTPLKNDGVKVSWDDFSIPN